MAKNYKRNIQRYFKSTVTEMFCV